jgi:hypothetical protein
MTLVLASRRRRAAGNLRGLMAVLALLASVNAAPGLMAPALGNSPDVRPTPPRWHVAETANFRLVSYGTRPVASQTAEACEQLRQSLVREWLGSQGDAHWTPKCQLVLHGSRASYLREVGDGGRSTVASALVDRRQGQVALRRIDVLATSADWLTTALPHELVHVVLADRFTGQALPRWLDEGMAILADPRDQQATHHRAAQRAIAAGAQFRIAELLALADYPPAGRWAEFYGQSASLVELLVAEQGHGRFLEFVELALEHGYEAALQQVYQFGVSELERRWHRQMAEASSDALVRSS